MKNQSLFILIITFIYCFIYALAENDYYIISLIRDKNDKNYDYETLTVKNKIDNMVNERMNDIYQLIIDNKDSYTNNGKLDKKLKEFTSLKNKRNLKNLKKEKFKFINHNRPQKDNRIVSFSTAQYISIESDLVSHICPVSNYYTIKAYLSPVVAKKVAKLPNVVKVVKNKKINIPKKTSLPKEKRATSTNNNNNNNNNNNKNNTSTTQKPYYDIEYIKKETQWKSVSVEKNAPLHLSLISQYNFNSDIVNSYDNNYYYPTTAGKGIDIFFLDAGIDTNHVDFDTYNGERTVTCDAIVTGGKYKINNKTSCVTGEKSDKWKNIEHGTIVASVSAGKQYGVAKKANIHMIATDFFYDDLLVALDYILYKSKPKPYKTIINVSRNGNSEYYGAVQDKINDVVKAGYIITASSGNEGIDACRKGKEYEFISGYANVISIGSTDNDVKLNNNTYRRGDYSNYGECVDIHAPGYVKGAGVCKNSDKVCTETNENKGTSFSSPIVAGVAALIMGENTQVKYNYKKMLEKLSDMSVKGIITNINKGYTPNQFINNGKRIVYSEDNQYKGCGILSGNSKCNKNQCCTENYKCITSTNDKDNLCYVEYGCQSEFGKCLTSKDSYSSQITNINGKGMTSNTLKESMNTSYEFAKSWLYYIED